ncbi:MAG: thiaminase II [Candidatus Bipolaricaulaceae bacterium]
MPEGGLTAQLRAQAAPLWEALVHHPFVVQLFTGQLPLEKFKFYLLQDYNYLVGLIRALALVMAKSEFGLLREVLGVVQGLATAELRNYADLLGALGLKVEDAVRTPPSAVNAAYVDFMIATAALGTPHEGLLAVLPCFWSYQDIAEAHREDLARNPNPLYVRWAESYLSEGYRTVVAQLRAAIDSSPLDFRAAWPIFARACRYERWFWDMAYHLLETWPGCG